MYTQRLSLEDPNWTRRDYDGVIAHPETERAQVVLAELWAEERRGASVVVNAMHPGWADTPSGKSSLPRPPRCTHVTVALDLSRQVEGLTPRSSTRIEDLAVRRQARQRPAEEAAP